MKQFFFLVAVLIVWLCPVFHVQAQTTMDIADAKIQTIGSTVTVEGVVLNGNELGNIRYIYDGTAAVGVFNAAMANVVVQGDRMRVTGIITEYNGLAEITSSGGGALDYTVLSSNNPLPEPVTISASDAYSEEYEGQLVRITNVTFMSGGTFSSASSNYDVTDASVATYQIRIYQSTEMATNNSPIPSETLNIVGIMSQFNDDYQLLPRRLSDFEYLGDPPILVAAPEQSNITTSSFTVSFETLYPGSTIVKYGLTQALELGEINQAALTTNHSANLTGLQAGNVYYISARSVGASGDMSQTDPIPMATVSNSSGSIKVYFNKPVDNSVSTGTNATYLNMALDDTLRAYIGRAQSSIDICMYTIDNENQIVTALQSAAAAGIQVRVVGDSGIDPAVWASLPGTKMMRPASLNGIMHNKFIIIDADHANPNAPIVWTGATNFTDDQITVDANNVIIFQDQSLARAYKIEFEEMLSGAFSNDKTNNTPKKFIIGGKNVEAYFSPTDDANQAIREAIWSADYDLYFGLLSFTRADIAYAITDEDEDGTFVAGIINDFGDDTGEAIYNILLEVLGNRVRLNNMNNIFHHKYAIVDPNLATSNPTVVTGSHNWTNSAQFRNDENTVVVHDATIANIYYQEFVKRYTENGGTELITFVNDPSQTNHIEAFPNPAAQWLMVTYNGQYNNNLNIVISDLSGKVIYTDKRTADNTPFSIDVHHFTKGMYLLNVNGSVYKFIVRD